MFYTSDRDKTAVPGLQECVQIAAKGHFFVIYHKPTKFDINKAVHLSKQYLRK